MYFLTYEIIKKSIIDGAAKDQVSKSRELAGTILAGGMGEFRFRFFACIIFNFVYPTLISREPIQLE